MASFPYQFYRDNQTGNITVAPGTNTPYGMQPISFQEALAGQLATLQRVRDPRDKELAAFKDLYNRFTTSGLTDADYNTLSSQFYNEFTPEQLKTISGGGQVASPFSNWNGAIVETSKIPQLEAEGATVQGGNVVGPSVAGLNPLVADSNYPSGGTGTPPQLTQEIYDKTMGAMDAKGYKLNPNANLDDPKTIAEFLRIAQDEVEPYYKSQLKVARDQFLRQQGYTTDDILRTETELEKKYGAQVRQLASDAANVGFAQSGKRVMEEKDLAEGTQSIIDENRRKLGFEAYGKAGEYAQTYGGLLGEKAPQGPQLANAPRVLQGETGFQRPGGTSAFYSLSNDVYDNLVGSAEKERVTGIRDLAQQQEELYRTNQANTRNII